ncbi:MAG: hypothetical protein WA021_02490 [Minisyncoccia bacterium]
MARVTVDRTASENNGRIKSEIEALCDTFTKRLAAIETMLEAFELYDPQTCRDIDDQSGEVVSEKLDELAKRENNPALVAAVAYDISRVNGEWGHLLEQWAFGNGYQQKDGDETYAASDTRGHGNDG